MYSVTRFSHERYGSVILIERVENGSLSTPFQAVQAALKERRLWQEAGTKKVRFLTDDQVMSAKQAEHWAHEEYKSLPKCFDCAAILHGMIFNNQLSKNLFFCSQLCADKNYQKEIDKQKEEEEIEFD